MSEEFKLEIVNPEKSFLNKEDVSEVVVPAFEGEMGILKDHISLITFLRPGLITVKGGESKKYFVEEGMVEVSGNNLLILTSTVKIIDALEASYIEKSIKKAEENLSNSDVSDKDRYFLSYKIETLKELRK